MQEKTLLFHGLPSQTGYMSQDSALQKIGQLAQQERLEQGYDRKAFAQLAGVNIRTLMAFEDGTKQGRDLSVAKIESALRWGVGSVDRALALDTKRLQEITLDDLRDWSKFPPEEGGVEKAALRAEHLSDSELITELTRRFRNYAIAASTSPHDESPASVPNLKPVPDWRDFVDEQGKVDLAAMSMGEGAKRRIKFYEDLGEESQDMNE